jgi:outer membrane protein OmpA-like peptidoglycan-associated protein
VTAGNEFAYAAALGYRFGGMRGKTEIGAELNGGVGLSEQDTEELPLETFLFVRHNPDDEWEIIAGPGFGTIAGYGVPIFRVFAGIRYTPTAHDADHDGIPDGEDECPHLAEDHDRYQDLDGCPEEDPDSDHDGVPDRDDECPDAKETINGVDDDDGCPDSGDPRVVYEDGEFKILDRVEFETGSAKLNEDSHSLLDQVALTVKANPQIEKVRVEGHTDSRGDERMNERLSQARAGSVRQYLINRGVDPRRLTAAGYGESRPLEEGDGEDAWAKNRRVEFIVESEKAEPK